MVAWESSVREEQGNSNYMANPLRHRSKLKVRDLIYALNFFSLFFSFMVILAGMPSIAWANGNKKQD